MKHCPLIFLLCFLFSLGVLSCSPTSTNSSLSSQDPVQRGKVLFEMTMIGENKAPGCVVCHSLEPGKNIVGPNLAGIATYAETAVSGMDAKTFLYQAIVEPDKHIMEGFPAGVMYANYAKDLSQDDIDALVAFLLTLK